MNREKIGEWVFSMLLWVFGGALYFFMEVVWKTVHSNTSAISWTMLALAIVLCIPLERFGCELPWELSLCGQAGICTMAITATEFVAGVILNLWLKLGVWDYSHLRGNILGQISPQFVAVWFWLSMFAIVLFDWMRYVVKGGERPHYTLVRSRF